MRPHVEVRRNLWPLLRCNADIAAAQRQTVEGDHNACTSGSVILSAIRCDMQAGLPASRPSTLLGMTTYAFRAAIMVSEKRFY